MEKVIERNQHKTSEGEFIYELLNLYELSPKMSESILDTAKRCLIRDNILKEGEIEVSIVCIEERSGKTIEVLRKKRVRLAIDNGREDSEVLKESGRISLRHIRIQRITNEAIEQEGILSQEDISRYLSCSVRTIKRDIRAIKKEGIEVITRGVIHNIGRGQTHKTKIVGLYLEGKTFSEINLKTRHSLGAIKRYIQDFIRVMMSIHHGISEVSLISSVTGLSERLIGDYKSLYEDSIQDKIKKARVKDLIRQWNRARTRLKKSGGNGINRLVPMIGGGI